MTNSKFSESIKTQRLQLLPVSEDLATMVAAFHGRNSARLAPWNPPALPGLDTETLQRERLRVRHSFQRKLSLAAGNGKKNEMASQGQLRQSHAVAGKQVPEDTQALLAKIYVM